MHSWFEVRIQRQLCAVGSCIEFHSSCSTSFQNRCGLMKGQWGLYSLYSQPQPTLYFHLRLCDEDTMTVLVSHQMNLLQPVWTVISYALTLIIDYLLYRKYRWALWTQRNVEFMCRCMVVLKRRLFCVPL